MRLKAMKTAEFDSAFEAGKEVSAFLGRPKARRPNQEPKRVNIDFPVLMVAGLDKQAGHLGVTRQSLTKMWIAGMLG